VLRDAVLPARFGIGRAEKGSALWGDLIPSPLNAGLEKPDRAADAMPAANTIYSVDSIYVVNLQLRVIALART
jgi:hypothetical protein